MYFRLLPAGVSADKEEDSFAFPVLLGPDKEQREVAQLLQKLVPAAENVLGHQLETLVEDPSKSRAVQEAEHQA